MAEKKLFAYPTAEVASPRGDGRVGWRYRWNTCEAETVWPGEDAGLWALPPEGDAGEDRAKPAELPPNGTRPSSHGDR